MRRPQDFLDRSVRPLDPQSMFSSPFRIGGQGPFELILVPVYSFPRNIPSNLAHPSPQVFGTPKTYNIPSSAVNNGKGLYNVQVDFPVNQKIFLVMSDATGFGSGGTSLITQVGPSLSGNSCNTTDPGVDFFFELNSALTECRLVRRPYTFRHPDLTSGCRTYAFSGYDGAIQPVTITVSHHLSVAI